jgi:hypothetical protein
MDDTCPSGVLYASTGFPAAAAVAFVLVLLFDTTIPGTDPPCATAAIINGRIAVVTPHATRTTIEIAIATIESPVLILTDKN